ncbi:MAG: carbonic anhydrase [Lentisphaerae bacterium GWF2_44_16]|nr:MAG: carbonic anhydrase [Lentisphaerae bacterium GWF2_44_16]
MTSKINKRVFLLSAPCIFVFFLFSAVSLFSFDGNVEKPNAEKTLEILKAGNKRFAEEASIHPDADKKRLHLAATENQGKYAYATVLACSDSRVPVELIFDAGIMDIFVIRVPGNVCNTDEIGSIEYGICHVKTPVLVILGHTRCGAITAVAESLKGHGHPLERNIPPLILPIVPAVKSIIGAHPDFNVEKLVPLCVEANIWQGMEDLFMKSPAVRELAKSGKVKVFGAVYELETGKVKWLPESKTLDILKKVEADPKKETQPLTED